MSDIDAKLKSVLQPPFLKRIPIAPLWNIDISRISIRKTSGVIYFSFSRRYEKEDVNDGNGWK
jgi:hypothetical protein